MIITSANLLIFKLFFPHIHHTTLVITTLQRTVAIMITRFIVSLQYGHTVYYLLFYFL